MTLWLLITIFILACFVGYFVIWQVTPALYSPLMSVSNAISGIVILGGILSLQSAISPIAHFFSYSAIFLGAINIFGGFTISQRMLNMFQHKEKKQQ